MIRTLLFVALVATVAAQPALMSDLYSWNFRRSADVSPDSCCEAKDQFCEARDKASCEAYNSCRGNEVEISCETELNTTRTSLFDFVCDDKDPCQDLLDNWCTDFSRKGACMDYAKCVIENAYEEEDGVDADDEEIQELLCTFGDQEGLWRSSAHACGEIFCLEETTLACTDENEVNCNKFVECIGFDLSDYDYDPELGCDGCENFFEVRASGGIVPSDERKYIDAICAATTKSEAKAACKEWEPIFNEKFGAGEGLEIDCDVLLGDSEDASTLLGFQTELGCLCTKPFPWIYAAAGGAAALLVCAVIGAFVCLSRRKAAGNQVKSDY